ncbi:MAG TPA: hypothetical protein ENK59_01650, partial [Thioploca sp.]|nr:hypothetical protein [Thioploca sp.]
MSLLMDALKKADEVIDTKQSTNINEDSKLEQELLPQFEIDSQPIGTSEQIFEQDNTYISDKWDDDFLPQFKDDQVENDELDNFSNSTSQSNLAEDNVEPNKLIEPSTEIKLPNTEN